MGYRIVIGIGINQPFQAGDIIPADTAITGDYCQTVIGCVGKAPADLRFDEPIAEVSHFFWKDLLEASAGLKQLAQCLKPNQQIIYLCNKNIKNAFSEIKKDLEFMPETDIRERVKWLIYWAETATKRYSTSAVIGLF
jgi:hypothetical protein